MGFHLPRQTAGMCEAYQGFLSYWTSIQCCAVVLSYPVLPALYMAANAFLLVVLLADPQQRKYSALGLLIVALGIPVYLIWRRRK